MIRYYVIIKSSWNDDESEDQVVAGPFSDRAQAQAWINSKSDKSKYSISIG